MILSISASIMQLKAFAEPALRDPPIRVAKTSQRLGIPCSARIMTGTSVINSNSMTLGLVRAKYAPSFRPTEMAGFALGGLVVVEEVISASLNEIHSSVTNP
jgi:hypothetical protein